MTTLNDAREAVYLRFTSTFTGVTADRVALDNEDFQEPRDGNWVRLVVRSVDREQDTLGRPGNRKFRPLATVFVQVYVPVDSGLQASDTLAKEAADVFEGVSFSGLDFEAAVVRETGPTDRWFQSVMEAPFRYEEIR